MAFNATFYEYEREVEREAERLVEAGVAAPWDAIVIAGRNVRERRRRRAVERAITDRSSLRDWIRRQP